MDDTLLYVPVRTKVFLIQTCVSLMHTNWHSVGCFFWPRENGQEFGLMSGEGSFLTLFRDSRKPLDSIRDKHCSMPSVGTTWYSASSATNGYTWAARDLRLLRRASGSALSVDRQTLDVFVIVKVLFWISQQLIIVKIWKLDWVRCNSLNFC